MLGLCVLAAALWAPGAVCAQETVADAVVKVHARAGRDLPPLIGVRVNDVLEGETWDLQFVDPRSKAGMRVITIRNGAVDGEREGRTWPFEPNAYAALKPVDVGLRLRSLRRIALDVAASEKIAAGGFTYVLSHPAKEVLSRWDLYVLDGRKRIMAVVTVSARDGSVLKRMTGPGETFDAVEKKEPVRVKPAGTTASKDRAKPKPRRKPSQDDGLSEMMRELRRIFD